MRLQDFIAALSPLERKHWAQRLKRHPEYLRQISVGDTLPGARLCALVERETDGLVTRAESRPDLFGPAKVLP